MTELENLLFAASETKDFRAVYQQFLNTEFFAVVDRRNAKVVEDYDFVLLKNEDDPDPMAIASEDIQRLKIDGDAIQITGGELIKRLPEQAGILIILPNDGVFTLPKSDIELIRKNMQESADDTFESDEPNAEPSWFERDLMLAKETNDLEPVLARFLNTRFFVLISKNPDDSELEDFEFVVFQNSQNSEPSLLVSEQLASLAQHDCDAVQLTGAQLIYLLPTPHAIAVVIRDQVFVITQAQVTRLVEKLSGT